jgi:predicted RNase H-like HicB family nuclease/predicted RNA binding protein YcfA (HicA-like mRNA interferase family)
MKAITYTVNIEPAKEGGYWAYVPALPGCLTQGGTLEEVTANAKQAVRGFVELLAEGRRPVPVERHHRRQLIVDVEVETAARGKRRVPTMTPAGLIEGFTQAGFKQPRERWGHFYLWHAARELLISVPACVGDLKRDLLMAILDQVGVM